MTGLDCLREEMMNRGLNKAQCNSKVAAVVLDIVANAGTKYQEMYEEEQEASKELRSIERHLKLLQDELSRIKRLLNKYEREMDEAMERREHCEDYIDEFNKSLQECETAEGRDAMRTAQMFVNSVDVDTKYDNTAYIIGLASILSGGKVQAIQELRKINKKLPINKGMVTI